MNAAYILWLRQIKRYMRSRARIISALAQPMMFLLAMGFGLRSLYASAGQGNYIQFLAPGIVGMGIIFSSVMSGMEMVWDRQFGFLKETLVAPVSRFSIMVGRVLGGATTATFQGILVLILATIFGFRPEHLLLLPVVIIVMLLIAMVFSSFGVIVGTVIQDMQAYPLITNFVVMPLFFLSGAMFPLHNLPRPFLFIVSIDPLTYGVDALRHLLIGTHHFALSLDIGVLAGLTLCMVAIGSYFFRRMEV